jgi:hypothetical protein
MRVPSVVVHTTSAGKQERWCMRCGLHVDEKYQIDLDYYTARQYLKIMEGLKSACDHHHERPDSKEELAKKVDDRFTALLDGQRELLKEIIRRLP